MESPKSTLGDAPCWGSFIFKYKNKTIQVPSFLNNVARYKSDAFWDWLLEMHEHEPFISLKNEHVIQSKI